MLAVEWQNTTGWYLRKEGKWLLNGYSLLHTSTLWNCDYGPSSWKVEHSMTVHNVAWVPLVIFNLPSANQDHKTSITDHFCITSVSFVLLLWMLALTEAKNAFDSIEAKVFIKATLPAECIECMLHESEPFAIHYTVNHCHASNFFWFFCAKGCDALAAWEGFV